MGRRKIALFTVFAILAALFLIYPNRALVFAPDWIIFAFSTASISLMAFGAVMFVPERLAAAVKSLPKWLRWSFRIFAVITFWHLLRHWQTYTASECAAGFVYLTVPLFACVFYPELRTALPRTLAILWCVDAAASLWELLSGHPVLGGLPLNKNWNAILLLVTSLFAVYKSGQWQKRFRIPAWCFIILLTMFLEIRCRSTGAFFSLVLTVLTVFVLNMKTTARRKILVFFVLAAVAASLLLPMLRKKAPDLRHNDRMYLFRQTLTMIADAPLPGYGIPSFEQEFLPYRTPEYFTLRHSAGRIDHPHNHLLFMAAGVGVAGLAAWLVFAIGPMILFLRKFREADMPARIGFSAFLLLFFHGQIDLILFKEPTNIIALLLIGMMWGALFPAKDSPVKARFPLVSATAGAVLTLLGLLMAGMNLCASIHFRMAERRFYAGDRSGAREHYYKCLQTAGWDHTNDYHYPIAEKFSFSDLPEDRETAMQLLTHYAKTSTPDYGHVHQILGHLMLRSNDMRGVQHLLRDAELYPLDPNPLLVLMAYYVLQGKNNSAAAVADELNKRFRLLKLDAWVRIRPDGFPVIEGKDGILLMRVPGFDPYKNVIR